MLSTKPYLIRAFYEWILDCACTPFIVINVGFPHCNVPQEFVEDGEIIFNVSPDAIRDLKLGNDLVEFKASFSGVVRIISAPVRAIMAIYSEENGQGMFFDAEDEADMEGLGDPTPAEVAQAVDKDKKQVSHLRLVE